MSFVRLLWISALLGSSLAFGGVAAISNVQKPEAGKAVSFTFGGENNQEFLLDGKPFQIRSGEMHPQRIPRSHWRHRIRAAKAMGLNTIAFYTFWNDLETAPGQWDLTGRRDIAAFIDMCQEEGMWVLFRPGPYVCGEWTLGGLPSYLLKGDDVKLRCTANQEFMEHQTRYLEKMAEIAIPRLACHGGPILMVQLENEYGSYKTNHDELAYLQWLKDFWEKKGAGPFYVSEGTAHHHLRFVPEGVAVGLDPAECLADMSVARSVAPRVPIFSSETYPGWLRHWGESNWCSAPETIEAVEWYMKSGTSFNLFVLHGGTNFGLTAGANSDVSGSDFTPDLTSYDYGSPISENGQYAAEYPRYREVITKALPPEAGVPDVPEAPPSMELPSFTPEKSASLGALFATAEPWDADLPRPATLESRGQDQGMALYSVTIPAGDAAGLQCDAHDFAVVYLDGKKVGTLNRSIKQNKLNLPAREKEARLSILVDTFGHINFNCNLEKDRKGIIGEVLLGGQPLRGWRMQLLDAHNIPTPQAENTAPELEGGVYTAKVQLDDVEDTFLDMSHCQKGYLWVNGHHLGRYWNIGPQLRLYCPKEFLKKGENEIVLVDVLMNEPAPIRACKERNMEAGKSSDNLNNDW